MAAAKLVVVGWDGATWDLLAPWVREGRLPNLARLMQAGCHAPLQSTPLPLSPAAWSTIVTGVNPGRHGVFDWFERRPGSYQVEYVHTGRLAARTLWQHLNDGEKSVGVFCLPMVYPAAPLKGFMISGMAAPGPRAPGFAYPPSLLEELEAGAGPFSVVEGVFYEKGREAGYLKAVLEWLESQRRAVRYLVERKPCDIYLLIFMQPDHAQHKLWRCQDPAFPGYDPQRDGPHGEAILQVYRGLDEALGELLGLFDEQTAWVVLSDHGAGPAHGVMYINRWLQREGYLRLRCRPGTWLKYGLAKSEAIPRAFRMASALGLGGLAGLFSKPARNRALNAFLSFEDIDWSQTRAYSRGAFGQIFINLKGREPDGIVEPGEPYERLVAEILAKLRALRHPESGQALITGLRRKEEVLHGPYLHLAADVMFSIQDHLYQSSIRLGLESGGILGPSEYGDSGSHRPEGILVMAGPGIQPGAEVRQANVADVLPTLLALADLPVPAGLDGRPLLEAFTPQQRARLRLAEGPAGGEVAPLGAPELTPEERLQLEERLRSLGYLG